ncbi:MAG: hypothetical protein IJT66_06315 [Clostridia bacterium]|nr:hypothetical protein [Clostridia bacterium]
MTASEKILSGILEEADRQAGEILQEAEEKAEALVAEETAKAQKEAEQILAQAQKKAAQITTTGHSAAELLKRDAALACKREQIEQTLRSAVQALNALEDGAYFDLIVRLVEKNRLSGAGEIALSARDLARNCGDFEKTMGGLGLTLCATPAEIDGGFFLKYGDVFINGEWSALLHEKRELLVDAVHRALFA